MRADLALFGLLNQRILRRDHTQHRLQPNAMENEHQLEATVKSRRSSTRNAYQLQATPKCGWPTDLFARLLQLARHQHFVKNEEGLRIRTRFKESARIPGSTSSTRARSDLVKVEYQIELANLHTERPRA
jgi:hypothetical protein